MPDNHHIDDMARQELSGYEAPYNADDWAAMSAMLDKRRKKPVVVWLRWAGLAAAVAAAILVGRVLLPVSEPVNAITATEDESTPASAAANGNASQSNEDQNSIQSTSPSALPLLPASDAGQMTNTNEIQPTPTTPKADAKTTNNTPVHWLANEVEVANDNKAANVPQAATSASLLPAAIGNNGSTALANPPLPGEMSIVTTVSTEKPVGVLSALPPITGLIHIADASTLPVYASIPESPHASRRSRFIQPYVGAYALAHNYSEDNPQYSYAEGLRFGALLWNGLSIETGVGQHAIAYHALGTNDTIDSRVHTATIGHLSYIELPTLVTYQLNGNARWDGFVSVGLRHLLLRGEEYHFHYNKLNAPSLPAANFATDTIITVAVNTRSQPSYEAIQQMGIAADANALSSAAEAPFYRMVGYLGAGVEYHITPGLSIDGGVQYQFALQPIGIEARYLTAFGASLGVKYRL